MSGNVMQDDDTLDGGYNSLDYGHDPLRSQERFGLELGRNAKQLVMHKQDRRRRRR